MLPGPLLAPLLIAAPAAAPVSERSSTSSTVERNQATVGELPVLQIATDDDQRLLAEWAQPTPPTTKERIERNKPIHTFLAVGGCRRDEAGQCDVTASFEVLDPDGAIYARQADAVVLKGPAPEPAANLLLSQSSLALIVEDGEKLGYYLVKAEVIDRNAKLTARTELKISVVEARAAK